MKFLFKFNKVKEVKVKKKETKQDGEDKVEITKTVTEPKTIEFALRKPTRGFNDAAELFYGKEVAKAIESGLMTNAQLSKRFADDGGTMSELEKKSYYSAYITLAEKEVEAQELLSNDERDEKQNKRVHDLSSEIAVLRDRIQQFEFAQSSLFQNTAETYARNHVITWWVLHLSYEFKGEEWVPFFGDGSYDDREEKLEEFEEMDDEFLNKLVRTFIYMIGFWYTGKASSEEEFLKTMADLEEAEKEGLFEDGQAQQVEENDLKDKLLKDVSNETQNPQE
jgi:hypothetical protein